MTSREEWFNIVEIEQGEQAVAQILESVIQASQDVIFERHIESQVLPYAVQFAKEAFIDFIEVILE